MASEWPAHTVETCRMMWIDGVSIKDIAAKVGRTKSAISGRAKRDGWGAHPNGHANDLMLAYKIKRATFVEAPRPPTPKDTIARNPRPWEDRASHECAWPIGTVPYFSCCNRKREGSSYCDAHHAKAFVDRSVVGIIPKAPEQRTALSAT